MDRTVEQLAEHPVPEDEDIVMRERVRTRRSEVLLVDVSGSMRGECVRTAAATVGALAAELARDDLAVIAFWSDAAVLAHLGQRVAPQALAESKVRIPARGLTNLAFPLQAARRDWVARSYSARSQVRGYRPNIAASRFTGPHSGLYRRQPAQKEHSTPWR
jgi:Mg-chelatase subunit ChlD